MSKHQFYKSYVCCAALVSLLILWEGPAEAFKGVKNTGKKKKAQVIKQTKILIPKTEIDIYREEQINLWTYYHSELEKFTGLSAVKDKSFMEKASAQLEILKEYYPYSLDLFNKGQDVYAKFIKKISRRGLLGPSEARFAMESFEDYRSLLSQALPEFQTGGFFGR